MTGYSRAQADVRGFLVTLELRSLNSRYREIQTRAPKGFLFAEEMAREAIKKSIRRGQILFLFTIERDRRGEGGVLNLNEALLKDYHRLHHQAAKFLKAKYSAEISELLRFPEVIQADQGLDAVELEPVLQQLMEEAVQKLVKMKEDEGAELEKDLLERIRLVEEGVEKVKALHEPEVSEAFSALKERVHLLVSDQNVNAQRLETEIALIADRHDITEEIVRLQSHLVMFKSCFSESEAIGKKLGFLLQEMNREVNTICSKTGMIEISHVGVSLKEELERIREQIQNVE